MTKSKPAERRTLRHDVLLKARLSVHPDDAGLVAFSSASPARNGWIEAEVVNLAETGVGVLSGSFFPRGCRVVLQAMHPDTTRGVLLEATVRVQRVVMTDRRPAYLIGGSLEDPTDQVRESLTSIVDQLEGAA